MAGSHEIIKFMLLFGQRPAQFLSCFSAIPTVLHFFVCSNLVFHHICILVSINWEKRSSSGWAEMGNEHNSEVTHIVSHYIPAVRGLGNVVSLYSGWPFVQLKIGVFITIVEGKKFGEAVSATSSK